MSVATRMMRRDMFPYLFFLLCIWAGYLGFHWHRGPHTSAQDSAAVPDIPKPKADVMPPDDDHRSKFIESLVETLVQPGFDRSAIRRECDDHIWTNDVVFQCDKIIGGVGNVRQELLTCLRWAMETGVGIILPTIRPRADANSTLGEEVVHAYKPAAPLSYFFDTDHFSKLMQASCPQMALYEDLESLPPNKPVQNIGILGTRRGYSKMKIRDEGTKFINEHKSGPGNMSLITFYRSYASYEVCNDGQSYANSFGQFFTFRSDVRRLAATVIYEMSQIYNLNIDPKKPINNGSYLGIHLRTATDAMKAGWSSFETQSELYLKYIAQFKLPVIYVASGNLSSISLFSEKVSPTPVVTKFTILSGDDIALLQSLSWDQQGQVDYLVLEKASQFLGITDSTFSWGIAAGRHTRSHGGLCGKTEWNRMTRRLEVENDISFRDEFTIIVGGKNKLDFNTKWFWP